MFCDDERSTGGSRGRLPPHSQLDHRSFGQNGARLAVCRGAVDGHGTTALSRGRHARSDLGSLEMIKTLVFVRRKPGMTFDDFARYWVESHGPIAAKLPGLRRLVTNLVRPELQRHEPPWDGLSCAWFESADAVRSVVSTPEFRAMIDDEENFVDTSERSPMIVTPYSPAAEAPMNTERLSDTIKTVVAIWRKSGMERKDFNTYWRSTHAELIFAISQICAPTYRIQFGSICSAGSRSAMR